MPRSILNTLSQSRAEFDLRHLLCVLLTNKALAMLKRGKSASALRAFKKSLEIARAEGFWEFEVRATEGISRIQYKAGAFDDAHASMLDLLELAKKASLYEFEMTALHGLWVVSALKREPKSAARHFARLTGVARKRRSHAWLVRALVDKSRPIGENGFAAPDPRIFRQLIRAESRREETVAAGWLWLALARMEVDTDEAISALQKCDPRLDHNPEMAQAVISAYESVYQLQWKSGKLDGAIKTLDMVARLAKACGLDARAVAAIDEKGCCLQRAGKYSEAVPVHERAAGRAKRLGLDAQQLRSLHNLAECHRRAGDAAAAIAVFDDAIAAAAAVGDDSAIIAIKHGRALSLELLGEVDAASSLFKECRDRSAAIGCWAEYVRACEALANSSWDRGRKKTAVRQYETALAACEKNHVFAAAPRIALNLSRLLRELGQASKGRRLLAKHIDAVADPFNRSEYHSTLAELSEEAGRTEDAREHWHAAIEAGEAVGDDDSVAYCRSQLAELEFAGGRHAVSIAELETLLKQNLSAEDRAIALTQLLKALFRADSENRAAEVFVLAREHMQKHGLRLHLIDIYMSLFDRNWSGSRASRLSALQAYAVAFVEAAEAPHPAGDLGKIIGHAMRKLSGRRTAPTVRQLGWLSDQFTGWLTDHLGDGASLVSWLTMPLRYAATVIPLGNDSARRREEHDRFFRELSEGGNVENAS